MMLLISGWKSIRKFSTASSFDSFFYVPIDLWFFPPPDNCLCKLHENPEMPCIIIYVFFYSFSDKLCAQNKILILEARTHMGKSTLNGFY